MNHSKITRKFCLPAFVPLCSSFKEKTYFDWGFFEIRTTSHFLTEKEHLLEDTLGDDIISFPSQASISCISVRNIPLQICSKELATDMLRYP